MTKEKLNNTQTIQTDKTALFSYTKETHCGFVVLLGAPNAGKSTLLNRFIGEKVSIVSPKVQTTRSRIRGIFVRDNTQIVFTDTPGIFKPKRRLDRAMVASAWAEAGDADCTLLLVDVKKGLSEETLAIINGLKKAGQKAVLVLNKIDLVSKETLLPFIQTLNETGVFTDTFSVSAQTGEEVEALLSFLIQKMPVHPFMFPADQISDLPQRLFAAEITREKLFLYLQQELPYSLTVETTSFQEKSDGSFHIEQTIFVQRESQKSIIIGKKGSMIKKIGEHSRKELSSLLEVPVHLFLFVKVRENWADDPERYRNMGLDFNV